MPQGAGLPGRTATGNGGLDVQFILKVGQFQRVHHDGPVCRSGKVRLQGPAVHRDLPVTGMGPRATDREFPLSGRVRIFGYSHGGMLSQTTQIVKGTTPCALCGWVGPAYTRNLRPICFPNGFFGSIPLIACSTNAAGLRRIHVSALSSFKPPG